MLACGVGDEKTGCGTERRRAMAGHSKRAKFQLRRPRLWARFCLR